MQVLATKLPEVKILEPKVFSDDRGFFFESFNQKVFEKALGIKLNTVQDNHSKSCKGVLRGIHYQIKHPQGKLVSVIKGSIFDVAVDLRKSSATFGQWTGETLSSENKRQLWMPQGFGHAFLVLSDDAEVLYKTTDYYYPEHERSIAWNDKKLNVDWPLLQQENPILSAKDQTASSLNDAEVYS